LVLSTGLRRKAPGKKFIPASEKAVCSNMKRITLEKVLWSLEDMAPEVTVSEETRRKAKLAVDRMLKIGRTG
jgi:quinolinate synthase